MGERCDCEERMMGVYIKNMKMPGACLACDFCNPFAEEPYCRRLMKITPKTTTLPDCPLVSVPPHGRLIDADALVKDLKRQCEEVFKIDAVSPDDFWIKRDKAYNERLWKTWCESFFEYLKARETIIEAEGRE